MCKNVLLFGLLLLATASALNAGRGGRATGYGGRRNYYGSQMPQQQSSVTQTPPQTPKEYLDNKSGFSTFGIISIIFAVILACLIFYYGIMCYPFLCRDEKKYRFIDMSSTITAATSRSIQSIENYPVDQKHEEKKDVLALPWQGGNNQLV